MEDGLAWAFSSSTTRQPRTPMEEWTEHEFEKLKEKNKWLEKEKQKKKK